MILITQVAFLVPSHLNALVEDELMCFVQFGVFFSPVLCLSEF